MLLGEPPQTQADLKFTLFSIPVRVSPFFWLIAFMLHINTSGVEPGDMLAWVLAVFVSVLVHEFGHALMARRFHHRPWITLHGLGGHAAYNSGHDTMRTRFLIIAAGPGAGFLFAFVMVIVAMTLGQQVYFTWSLLPVTIFWTSVPEIVYRFLLYLLYVNIIWGLFNLLPIYPLDGGQIARLIWVKANPWEGVRKSLILSFMTCIFMALWSLMGQNTFMILMFAWMGYDNFKQLQATSGGGGYGRGW